MDPRKQSFEEMYNAPIPVGFKVGIFDATDYITDEYNKNIFQALVLPWYAPLSYLQCNTTGYEPDTNSVPIFTDIVNVDFSEVSAFPTRKCSALFPFSLCIFEPS